MCFTSRFLGSWKGNSKGSKECTAATICNHHTWGWEVLLVYGSFFCTKGMWDQGFIEWNGWLIGVGQCDLYRQSAGHLTSSVISVADGILSPELMWSLGGRVCKEHDEVYDFRPWDLKLRFHDVCIAQIASQQRSSNVDLHGEVVLRDRLLQRWSSSGHTFAWLVSSGTVYNNSKLNYH